MPERRRRRRRRKKSLLLLLGECLDGDDETIEKKMSLLSLPFSAHSLAHEGDRAVLARQKGVERRVLGRDNLGDIDAGLGEGLSVFVGGGREAFFFEPTVFFEKKASTEARVRALRARPPGAKVYPLSNAAAGDRRALGAGAERKALEHREVGKGGSKGTRIPSARGDCAARRRDGQKETDEKSEEKKRNRTVLCPRAGSQALRIPLYPYLGAGCREDDNEQGFVGRHGGLRGAEFWFERGGSEAANWPRGERGERIELLFSPFKKKKRLVARPRAGAPVPCLASTPLPAES